MNTNMTDEQRSDLCVGACVFRVPPYDKNPQSQRIAALMESLAAPGAAPAPTSGDGAGQPDAHSPSGSPENTNNLGGDALTTASSYPSDAQIMGTADYWFVTGENQRKADGYYYRSLSTPSNVRGSDLLEFARAIIANFGSKP